MIIDQLRSTDGTGTLSYLLIDEMNGVSVIIDPNREDIQKISYRAEELRVRITHVIDTHTHADHISGAGVLKELYGAEVIMHENTKHKWKVVDEGDAFGIGDKLRANAQVNVDRFVHDGEVISAGAMSLKFYFTPGHSDNHITVHVDDAIFTGDLLLIGQAGRSDLPSGNAEQQYDSLFTKILPLPDSTKIYPGHDYADNVFTTLGKEKKSNPFLQPRTKAEYIDFVKEFFPPLAESIEGGKMSLQCGATRVVTPSDTYRNISTDELVRMMNQDPTLLILDVREPFELVAFGAIRGVKNIPIGSVPNRVNEITSDKNSTIAVVCQTGTRSAEAAHYLTKQGFTNILNVQGGTSAWLRGEKEVTRGAVAV